MIGGKTKCCISEEELAARYNLRRYGNDNDRACQMTKRATSARRALTSLIEDGPRLMMAGSRRFAKGTRALPPVSKATGGPMPGIGLIDLSAVQEIDDLDRLDRMRHLD
jgi:hypothetical protein